MYTRKDMEKLTTTGQQTDETPALLAGEEEGVGSAGQASVEGGRELERPGEQQREDLGLFEEAHSRNRVAGNGTEKKEGYTDGSLAGSAWPSGGCEEGGTTVKEAESALGEKERRATERDDAVAIFFQEAIRFSVDGEEEANEEKQEARRRRRGIRRLSTLLLSCSFQDEGQHTPCCFTSVGVYVPQLGDVLRYFPQLHQNPVLPHDRIQVWQPELFLPCDVFVESLSFEFPGKICPEQREKHFCLVSLPSLGHHSRALYYRAIPTQMTRHRLVSRQSTRADSPSTCTFRRIVPASSAVGDVSCAVLSGQGSRVAQSSLATRSLWATGLPRCGPLSRSSARVFFLGLWECLTA